MRIYVASSWRNEYQPVVVARLEALGHEVYDFKNPPGAAAGGFHWRELDPNWQQWDAETYRAALAGPVAQAGFKADMDALRACDACLLVLPCGRSAHLELGWAVGAGKKTAVMLFDERDIAGHTLDNNICRGCDPEGGAFVCGLAGRPSVVPELMYLMCDKIIVSMGELDKWALALAAR